MKILLYGVEVITSLLLILVILAQRSKGQGGLGGAAFGGMGESIFGNRAGNVLTKATVILGCIFMANTLGLSLYISKEAARQADLAASIQVPTPTATVAQPPAGVPGTPSATEGTPVPPATTEGESTPAPAAGTPVETPVAPAPEAHEPPPAPPAPAEPAQSDNP